jgi:hypothetical protein
MKVCQITLIFLFYCKGFGAEIGAGEKAEFCAVTQHSQNGQLAPILGIVLVFLSFYSLEFGGICSQHVFVTFDTNFIPGNKLFQC